MLIGTLIFGNPEKVYAPSNYIDPKIKKDFLWDKAIKEQSTKDLNKPYYHIKPNHCSKYARLSTKKVFGKKYNGADAWNLQYSNPVIYEFKGNEKIKDLIIDEILKPGMLLGSKWPVKNIKKYGKYGKDIKGNPIEYTHVVTYWGINDKKEPLFLHQWGRNQELKTEKELKKDYNLEFVEIMNDK